MRYNDRIETTPAALRDFAKALRLVADSFDSQAASIEAFGMSSIGVTHWKSAKKGVSGFSAFAGAVQDALLEHKLNGSLDSMPLTVEQSQALVRHLEDKRPATKKKTK